MRVFLTGGTGTIGRRLIEQLSRRGDHVLLLTRRPEVAKQLLGNGGDVVEGDPMQAGAWMSKLGEADAVIHLYGEGIFNRRWSAAFKQTILDSRVQSTRNVATAITQAANKPKVLVSASAIGIYGPHGDEEVTESTPAGSDYMSRVCLEWEAEAKKAESAATRLAIVRIGVVLDQAGGALRQMMLPFKLFAGGPAGSGKQLFAWVHHADIVGLLLFALDNQEARGPINGTAPNPVTNRQFSTALGNALHRPSFMPTPGFGLKLMLGEVADVILTGQRVLPRVALRLGYKFAFPTIEAALANIFSS